MFFGKSLLAVAAAVSGVVAAPTNTPSTTGFNFNGTNLSPDGLPQLPFPLPPNFPVPSLPSGPLPYKFPPVPTHFALFGYSFDKSIFGQNFYASGQPYNKDFWGFVVRPEDAYKNQTYGSYAFGIGPHKHIFAHNDGRIGTTNYGADAEKINWMLFESWADWWRNERENEHAEPIPTCKIIPFFDVLVCSLQDKLLKFAFCKSDVPSGIGYTADTLVWGTDVAPCTEVVLHAKQVPKTFGNQFPKEACPAYPDIAECKQ